MAAEKMFLSVVAPVFNEQDAIESVVVYWNKVLAAAKCKSEIVLTNDGSVDDTGAILKKLQKRYPRLKVVTYQKNGGYGRALSSSIATSSGEWVVTIDSDGQFDLVEYRGLLDMALGMNLDGVTGYRKKKMDSLFRVFADRVLNVIVKTMFGVRFKDTNCALKVVRGDLMRSVRLEAKGYPTPTEIMIKLHERGAKLGEAPITHIEREGGLSKLKPFRTGINFLRFLFYLKRKIALYRKNIIHSL